jgi:regulator of replication initiation timing
MVISWVAKDESGKDLRCNVVLNINSGLINIKGSTVDGKSAEPRKILELAKQNEALRIENKALHGILGEFFAKQLLHEGKKNTQSSESITPSSSLHQISIEKSKEEELQNEMPFFGS